jgi:hypothetical protein
MPVKRVVGHMRGGPGNQLFIFAASYALARRNGATLYLDTSAFARDWKYKHKYILGHFKAGETAELRDFPVADLTERLYRKACERLPALPARIGPLLGETPYLETEFDPAWSDGSLRERRGLHVFGFRQNERYFSQYADDIRVQFSLVMEASAELRAQADQLEASEAVCIHFRRRHEVLPGTNIPDPKIKVLDAGYYHRAVALIRERVPNPVFYCFGDDLNDVDALLPSGINRVIFPDTPDRPFDIRDSWLMRRCRHFVMANSTFSWWAAWLGQKPGSVVVCPDTKKGFIYQIAPAEGWLVA